MITLPLRVLLVEDNEADVVITVRTLQKLIEAPEIQVVEDLESCRESMTGFIPDVVISDYNLPGCTGLDVLHLVKEKDPSVAFIFLTGTVNDEELAANTILAGASGYILKKNMKQLQEKLRPLLKQVVFKMSTRSGVREKMRQSKISVNQIYDYLDTLKLDNENQQENIDRIKDSIKKFKVEKDDRET